MAFMVILPVVYGVFLLLVAVLGCISFHKIGAYPYPEDLFDALKGIVPRHTIEGREAFQYTLGSPFGWVWGAFFLLSYLIALVISLEKSIGRMVAPLFANAAYIGAVVYLDKQKKFR